MGPSFQERFKRVDPEQSLNFHSLSFLFLPVMNVSTEIDMLCPALCSSFMWKAILDGNSNYSTAQIEIDFLSSSVSYFRISAFTTTTVCYISICLFENVERGRHTP